MTSTAIAEIQRLLRYGFTRTPVVDEDGRPEVLIFQRDWRGWREVVLIYSESEARAYRTPVQFSALNPLYVPPGTAETLIPLGDVVTVVHALLTGWSPPPLAN